MSDTHGTVCWSELLTRDCPGAMAFYRQVLGWQFTTVADPEGGDYHVGTLAGRRVAGVMDMDRIDGLEGAPPHWLTYFSVDDLDRAVAEALSAGGTVLRPEIELPGTGRIALLRDGTGALTGLLEHGTGAGGTVRPGWTSAGDPPDGEENFPV